jgi:uncharacterized damage-inducible protein DinB
MADNDQALLRDALRTVLLRDLTALDREIAAYPDDESLWLTPPGISNSAGNLALHLTCNIRHFFGATLAKNGYVRDRDAEFATKGLTRDEIRAQIKDTLSELEAALDEITDDQFESVFPLPIRDFRVRTSDMVVHLAVHFGYHLGQIDYHRRLLTKDPVAANAMAMDPLRIDV